MKKIFSYLILSILFFINIIPVFAHPLDISVSTGTIQKNTINFTTYFHSFEVEYLLKNNWIDPDGVIDYFNNAEILESFVKKNIVFTNNNKSCKFKDFTVKDDEAYKILTEGLWVNYKFECNEDIENIYLEKKYFIEFPLQTNRITLYNLNNGIQNIKPLIYKVFTNKVYTLDIDIKNLKTIASKDTDNDGLSDEEEKIYGTDPNKIDTDWDNYTDKEEVDFGWNAINSDLWPAQEYKETLDLKKVQRNIDNLELISSKIWTQNLSDFWYGNDYLKQVMKYIDNFFSKNEGNILYVFLIVFWLGIVHAIWPWHSKSLLVAYTLEKNHWYKKWMFFALIFTLTHILDILVLFLITKVIITFVDISKFNYYIQVWSSILLFILSLFLLYRAFKKKRCQHLNKKPEKWSLFIAFLAGLAPCSFAWSIFLLLIAVWKSSWIIPLIIALWFGIFTTLVWIVILAVFLKNRVYSKAENIWFYSTILSASIIFIISIVMMMRVF
jgi:ABC-type nickel/cobalt efflux system permease component RcnA